MSFMLSDEAGRHVMALDIWHYFAVVLLRDRALELGKKRAYYRSNKRRIQASNRRSFKRHGHRWVYKRRYKIRPRRQVVCADCGISLPVREATRYPLWLHKRPVFYRCSECEEERGRELPNPKWSRAHKNAIEKRHLFKYADILSPQEPEPEMEFDASALSVLSEQEMTILTLRYGGWSLEQVGNKYKVTRERIRQMQLRAVTKVQRRVQRNKFLESIGQDLETALFVARATATQAPPPKRKPKPVKRAPKRCQIRYEISWCSTHQCDLDAGDKCPKAPNFHTVEKRIDTVCGRLNDKFGVIAVPAGKFKKGDVLPKDVEEYEM